MKRNIVMNKRFNSNSVFVLLLLLVTIVLFHNQPEVLTLIIILPFFIISILFDFVRMCRLPKIKVAELINDELIIYGYNLKRKFYVKYKINIHDITYYNKNVNSGGRHINYYYLQLYTNEKYIVLKDLDRFIDKNKMLVYYDTRKIKKMLDNKLKELGIYEEIKPDKIEFKLAKIKFKEYLSNELNNAPFSFKYAKHYLKRDNKRFYIFKFKRKGIDKSYLIGINGGYLENKSRKESFSFTKFELYDERKAFDAANLLIDEFGKERGL